MSTYGVDIVKVKIFAVFAVSNYLCNFSTANYYMLKAEMEICHKKSIRSMNVQMLHSDTVAKIK